MKPNRSTTAVGHIALHVLTYQVCIVPSKQNQGYPLKATWNASDAIVNLRLIAVNDPLEHVNNLIIRQYKLCTRITRIVLNYYIQLVVVLGNMTQPISRKYARKFVH